MAYVQEALGWLPRQDHSIDWKRDVTGEARWTSRRMLTMSPNKSRSSCSPMTTGYARVRHEPAVLALSRWFRLETGKQALEEATRRRPDLVLTDVMMPEMDGFALLDALRQNPATRTVPVIMLSARAGEEASIEGIEAGADDYLTKPFTARELVARVEAQMKMARLRKEAHGAGGGANARDQPGKAALPGKHWSTSRTRSATFDREFRVTYMNRAAMEIAERSGDAAYGPNRFGISIRC